MSNLSSIHHSFDIELAKRYGVDEAILIHHFLHWIRINRLAKRNIHDGKCWTYQTRKDIQIHFPYWNVDRVKYLCEKLRDEGVLVCANYNKSSIDKTLWYAFADEVSFKVDEESLNKVYEGQKCPSMGKSAFREGKSAQAIPDSLPDTKTTYENCEKRVSADAIDLAQLLLQKIKEKKPDFKPKGFDKWANSFDLMLRIDERSPIRIKEIINWMVEDINNLIYIQSAKKFRDEYDRLELKMLAKFQKGRVNGNREYARKVKEKFPDQMKNMAFDDKYVRNIKSAKEVPFDLPEVTFQEALLTMFGGSL